MEIPKKQYMTWDKEKTRLVVECFNKGMTATQTGKLMKIGRGAVVGKWNRLGLHGWDRSPASVSTRKKYRKEEAILDLAKRVSTDPDGCRWPLGDLNRNFRFCNKPVAKDCYCEYHWNAALRPLANELERYDRDAKTAKKKKRATASESAAVQTEAVVQQQ